MRPTAVFVSVWETDAAGDIAAAEPPGTAVRLGPSVADGLRLPVGPWVDPPPAGLQATVSRA
ncbi:MAG TPA: hypothetical protein VIM39_13250, partial [Candidatus Limnocylindrales bacterium]